MRNTPITDELAREFSGKRVSSREAGAVWNLCRDLERELAEARSMTEGQWLLKVAARLVSAGCKSDGIVDALDELIKQRDHYKAACDQYSEDEMLCKLAEVTKQRDALAEALKRIMKLTTPDQNMPYCKDDRIHGIAGDALEATEGSEP